MAKGLNELQREVSDLNFAKGWLQQERTFAEEMMLIVTETAEAVEAFRSYGMMPRTREDGKPEDVPSELADILIRLMDTAHRYGVDLESEFNRKMEFNWTRSYRHGGKRL